MPGPTHRDRSERAQRETPEPHAVVSAKIRVPASDALPRERLEFRLGDLWSHRLGLVVAPAGSGKTTLLARFAGTTGVPVAWYRAETWDADEAALLRHLQAALTNALPGVPTEWDTIETAAQSLEAWVGGKALLVVDDLHTLEGTPAEAAFERFLDYRPSWLAVLVGSRLVPEFNVSRLRVSGELLEIDADDLRFRSWEVERLFRDYYREQIPPGDVATLARRTEGWAAGLQLFHLATRGKPAEERRRILAVTLANGRLVREYLARNVLADLPAQLREFLIETFVLGKLSGALCDRLLGRTGSAGILEDLARRQIFTVTVDQDDGSYRYHEVLRAHLDRMLVDLAGETEARSRHARAAALLEEDGSPAEALAAYCRAEDWPAVQRLLGRQGEVLVGTPGAWLGLLPPALARHDPWIALATARQARAEGRWSAALDAFARSEAGFGGAAAASDVRAERRSLAAWLDPAAHTPADWPGQVRRGLAREPLTVAREAGRRGSGTPALVRGLLELAAGVVASASTDLEIAAADPDLGEVQSILAAILAGVAAALAGREDGPAMIETGAEAAERAGLPWLAVRARIAGRRLAHSPGDADTPAIRLGDPSEDLWGTAIDRLIEAWAAIGGPIGRLEAADEAAASFRMLGVGVLEAWARSLAALGQAELETDDAREAALSAESLARTAGVPGARYVAYLALGRSDPSRAVEFQLLADAVRRDTGLAAPPVMDLPSHDRAGMPDFADAIRIRTFGRFSIEVAGRPVRLQQVRPRARTLLRLLALRSGTPVHREVLCDALWPDMDRTTAGRNLHVAISSLRSQLGEQLGPDGGRLLQRDGDAYQLAVPDEAVDVRRFETAIAEGRAARARGDRASAAFGDALALHRGELLSEEGPAEWAVEWRDRCRVQAVEAAQVIAQEALLDGDFQRAVDACRAGLELDRYHDPLWKSLIQARDRAGDSGAALRDRREYAAALADLGIAEPSPINPS